MSRGESFVSLATNDSYATGALALGQSIRYSGSNRRLTLMISEGVTEEMRHRLSQIWDELVDIEELDSGDSEHLALLQRPELGITFSKINAWRLVQYSKCVFLDADTLILQNIDELFEREELSAAPDIGWPDCFNSGVFVFEPSLQTFHSLVDLWRQSGSFDGGDQGLLNLFWSDWATKDIKHHLPFTFNVTPNATYGYAPAFQQFSHNIKIIHFIGAMKPWQHKYLPEVDAVILEPGSYASQNAAQDYLKRWWQVYTSLQQPTCPSPQHQSSEQKWSSSHKEHHYHHNQSREQSPILEPNIGSGSSHRSNTASSQLNPYHNLGTGSGDTGYDHSVTPLDSISQFPSRPSSLSSSQAGLMSGYSHSITPLDSTSSLLGPPQIPPLGEEVDPLDASSSSSHLISPLSHEDIHSHISLSFYSQNGMFDKISSLAHMEPRTYYTVSGPQDEGCPDYETGSSSSSWSLSRSNSLPSFHTPLSLPFDSVSFLHKPISQDNLFLPHEGSYPLKAPLVGTEYDASAAPVVSHDSHVTMPSLLAEKGTEHGMLLSDSVLPKSNHIFSLPLSTHTPPSTTSPMVLKTSKEKPEDAESSSPAPSSLRDRTSEGRKSFESGNIDYKGTDSFHSIQAHIDYVLHKDEDSKEDKSKD